MFRKLPAPADAGWLHVMHDADPAMTLPDHLARLEGACNGLPVEVHAYCILPGHIHLLVRAHTEAAHAFRATIHPRAARPHVRRVHYGRHLMEVSRYVHLNPVHAGLCARPEDWPYSSLRGYLGDPKAPPWLTTGAVLGFFGTIGGRHRYRAYVRVGLDPGTRDAEGRPRWRALFGPGSATENDAWRIEPVLSLRHGASDERTPPTGGPPLALAHEIAGRFEVALAAVRSSRLGGRRGAVARGVLVAEARAFYGYRLSSLARFTGYRSAAVAAAAAERYRGAVTAGALPSASHARSRAPSPSPCRPSGTPDRARPAPR